MAILFSAAAVMQGAHFMAFSQPVAIFHVAQAEICAPYTITFINNSSGGITYTWYIDETEVFQSPTPENFIWNFENSTAGIIVYIVKLVVENAGGEQDELTRDISVYPEVSAGFTADVTEGCSPLHVSFTNNSSGDTGGWEWNFGDGGSSGLFEPAHTFHNMHAGADVAYTVSLVATSPHLCKDTATLDITVSPHIEALFAVDQAEGCHELEVTISNQSIGADSYLWDFGDGTTGTGSEDEFTHTLTNNSDVTEYFLITLIAENDEGCRDETFHLITVHPRVTAGFSADPPEGCSQLSVTFENTSTGADWYLWDFGDGGTSSQSDPVHTYEKNLTGADVVYPARLIAVSDNFCSDTTDFLDITVNPHVEANFTLQDMEGCHPLTVTINNQSAGADSYLWSFTDGSPDLATTDATFTRTFENTTGSIQVYTITLLAENSAHHCFDILEQQVTVYPAVSAGFNADPEEGCSQLSVQFTNGSTGASSYLWEFGDGGSSAAPDPLHTYEKNFTGADVTYQARLIAFSGQLCSDTTGFTDIIVYPHVEAGFSAGQAEGCHPFTITITDQSAGAGTYTWDMGDGTVYNTSAPFFDHTYNNTGNSAETFTITLTVENSRGCSDILEREITIFPELISAFSFVVTDSCEPMEVTFTSESVNAESRHWDFGDGTTSTEEHPQHTFTNNRITDTTYTVRLTVFSAGGECVAESFRDIVVPGRVRAGFTFSEGISCNPFEVEFTDASLGADTRHWDFGDGTSLTTVSADPVTHIFSNSSFIDIEEYTVTLTVENHAGCTDQVSYTVRVYPHIEALFSASETAGCHPLTVDFSNFTAGAAYYFWDFGDGNSSAAENPVHTFTNTGSADSLYRVMLVSTASNNVCSDTFFMDMVVHPHITAGFTLSGSPHCTPSDVLLENSSVNGAEYHWDFGDGTDTITYNTDPFVRRFENPAFSGIATYQVTMTAYSQAGCSSETERTVAVYPDIIADFDASDTGGCHPLTVSFTNLGEGAAYYIWDFGDGSSSSLADPVHTFTNTGDTDSIYRVRLISTASNNVCSDSFFMDIRVHPYVKAGFSFPESIQCSPAEFVFSNSSIGGHRYGWDFGDGSDTVTWDMNDVSHRFSNPDHVNQARFTITLTAESAAGCTHQVQKDVYLYPNTVAAVSPSVTEGCHPLEVEFENLSQGAFTWEWDFDDGTGTNRQSPTHLFTNFTNNTVTRNVSLRVVSEDYCSSDTSFTVTIHPLPKPVITIKQSVACPPFDLLIGNNSQGAVNYIWDFGDGNFLSAVSSDTLTHTYHNPDDDIAGYDLKLIAETSHGCIDSVQQKIFVYPRVTSSFSSITEGCSPLTVRFVDQSARAEVYEWELGDGNISRLKEPTHQYFNNSVNDTSYYVQQVVTSQYGCRDTTGYFIDVYPQPVSEFSALPTHQTYPSSRVELENLTNEGFWDFLWDFDDGQTSPEKEPGFHVYGDWGDYDISLSVSSSNCSHSVSHRIRILPPPPVAGFDQPGPGCVPHGVQFVNTSAYGHSYLWEFGDGNTSSEPEPYHVYEEAGIYQVRLMVTGDGGTEFAYREVVVYRQPEVNFMVSPELVMLPGQHVQLFNQSLYGNRYLWNFGDGSESGEKSPLHLYREEGWYDISLSVWTEHECYGELVRQNAVRVTGEGIIAFPNAFRPDPSGPSGGYYDPGAENPNRVFYPLHAGIDQYRLEIYNRWGELLFISEDVNIGWDGYHQGRLCKLDVYVWKVWGTYLNGEKFIKAGDVTLLR